MTLAVLLGLGTRSWIGATVETADRPTGATASPSTTAVSPSRGTTAKESPVGGFRKHTGAAKERAGRERARSRIPATGPGTFGTSAGGGRAFGGTGRVLTYRVQVESGIGISPDSVSAVVDHVLKDPRGWTADGTTGFRRVSGGVSDFRIRLATAGTVDHVCGQYGLDTGGELNCDVGQDVMVNLKRWTQGSKYYAHDITAYRALIVNHEVGHFLGHGHEGCPGPGKPAPVMMQQIKGLHGCTINVWPYDRDRRRITGPAVT